MNPKTDSPREFSSEYLQLLVAITGATLVLVFGFERLFSHQRFTPDVFIPFPWIVAAGQTIDDGLQMFSGKLPTIMSMSHRLALLADMLVVFVLGPTLLLMSWRKMRLEKEQQGRSSIRVLWTLLFVVGGVISFGVMIPAIPIAIIQRSAATSLFHAQAVQTNKDFIINDINFIALYARQHKILPKSMGGGEGSYQGFSISRELVSTENGDYVVTPSPNQCAIKATSKLYPSAAISVVVNEAGNLREWTYTGPFE